MTAATVLVGALAPSGARADEAAPADVPAAAEGAPEASRVRVAERLRESTVAVEVGDTRGSGFVVGPERWVVTSAHVVSGYATAPVLLRFSDGSQARGELIALDAPHDLAVVAVRGRVRAQPLPIAREAPRVGQSVLAFGSPYGLDGTLTRGIVSAVRDQPLGHVSDAGGAPVVVHGVLQTDAPLNPGSSGGPLVDSRGEVVGVSTAIVSIGGGSQGIGFAVPASDVRALLDQLRARDASPGAEASSGDGAASPASGAGTVPQPGTNAGSESHPAADLEGDVGAADRVTLAGRLGLEAMSAVSGAVSGLRLRTVRRSSAAFRAGLRGSDDPAPGYVRRLGVSWDGHVILGVDGTSVGGLAALEAALTAALEAGRPAVWMHVTVGEGLVDSTVRVPLPSPAAPASNTAPASKPAPADARRPAAEAPARGLPSAAPSPG
ncbi:MAG: trypsin-like peptidase domain-containing protein [Myxococcales bacterium]|nr:trypsin-like peptidase domain-containing protein [Myxococcales bacterium]